MKTGLKLHSTNENYLEPAAELFSAGIYDYIELYIVPDSLKFIEKWSALEIPFIIHAPHSMSGLNPARKESAEQNLNLVGQVDEYRNALRPEFIIFHPGIDGEIEESIRQFESFIKFYPELHPHILIENKPVVGLNNESCIGSTPDAIRKMLTELNTGFCLDIGHAIYAAAALNRAFREFLKEFSLLEPAVYHLSDGKVGSVKDIHLHLGEGDLPLGDIIRDIPPDAMLTLETPKGSKEELNSFKADIEFVRRILQ